MVNTRSAKENKTKVSAEEGQTEPAIEIGLETPDQSVDEVEKKCNIRPEDTYRRKIKLSPKTTG